MTVGTSLVADRALLMDTLLADSRMATNSATATRWLPTAA